MAHVPARSPSLLIEGQLIPSRAGALARRSCACGKDGTLRSHGGFSCGAVLAMRARISDASRSSRRTRPWLIAGTVLGAAASVAIVAVLIAQAIATGVALTTWLADHWLILVIAAVALLLMGGGATCAGLHCGGCKR